MRKPRVPREEAEAGEQLLRARVCVILMVVAIVLLEVLFGTPDDPHGPVVYTTGVRAVPTRINLSRQSRWIPSDQAGTDSPV